MVLKFYYNVSSPPSKAVWMLLEEMGIEYEPHVVDLQTGEHKQPAYKEINPLAQVPAIVDGDFKLWESRAILQYLANKYRSKSPNMYPTDPKKRAIIDMIMFSDASAYEEKILPWLNIGGVFQGQGLAEDKRGLVDEALKMYNLYLDKKKCLGGDHLSIADFICFNSLAILDYGGFRDWDNYPNVRSWYENCIKKLKSYKTCIQDSEDVFGKIYKSLLAKNQGQEQSAE